MLNPRHAVAVLAATAALTLSGCTAAAEPVAEATDAPPAVSEATAAPAASETTPAPLHGEQTGTEWTTARTDDGTCAEGTRGGIQDEGTYSDHPQRIGETLVRYPDDAGPQDYARGEVTLNADGMPVAYVVAPGDAPRGLVSRFCIPQAQLALLNMVRRNTAYSTWQDGRPGTEPMQGWITLYAGDTINLDPATVTTVGDENGQVHAHDPGFYLPPQR